MIEPSLPDPPFALWTVFRDAPRWGLRSGCPPTLANHHGWGRVLRASVLFGAVGMASSGFTVLVSAVANVFADQLGEWAMFLLPGVWFGLIVLVPASRWLGRGWIRTLLAVPVSTGAYYLALVVFFTLMPILRSPIVPPFLGGLLTGMTGGGIVGLWMTPWRWSRRAWRPLLWTAALGGVGAAITSQGFHGPSPSATFPLPEPLERLLGASMLFTPFQMLAAVGLGAEWWSAVEVRSAECEVAE